MTINTASTIDAQNDLPIAKEGLPDPNTVSSDPNGSPMPIKDPTI